MNFGSRFSWNALTASTWSDFVMDASSSESESGRTRFETALMNLLTAILEDWTANGAPLASRRAIAVASFSGALRC